MFGESPARVAKFVGTSPGDTPQNYVVPYGATAVIIYGIGPGGAGGGGAKHNTGNVGGGGGGGGGSLVAVLLPADLLPRRLYAYARAGCRGGAGATVDNTSGSDGEAPTNKFTFVATHPVSTVAQNGVLHVLGGAQGVAGSVAAGGAGGAGAAAPNYANQPLARLGIGAGNFGGTAGTAGGNPGFNGTDLSRAITGSCTITGGTGAASSVGSNGTIIGVANTLTSPQTAGPSSCGQWYRAAMWGDGAIGGQVSGGVRLGGFGAVPGAGGGGGAGAVDGGNGGDGGDGGPGMVTFVTW